jgi:hypothetical protein
MKKNWRITPRKKSVVTYFSNTQATRRTAAIV